MLVMNLKQINNMIQKRFQYFTKQGIVWTEWRDYCEDDSQLSRLQTEEKYQLKPKLLNEFRIKDND